MVDMYLVALRTQKFLFFRLGLRSAISLILPLVFLPILGLWGVVIHDLLIVLVITQASYRYLVRFKPELRFSARSLLTFNEQDKNLPRIFLRVL
jgi:hypothetical protein